MCAVPHPTPFSALRKERNEENQLGDMGREVGGGADAGGVAQDGSSVSCYPRSTQSGDLQIPKEVGGKAA